MSKISDNYSCVTTFLSGPRTKQEEQISFFFASYGTVVAKNETYANGEAMGSWLISSSRRLIYTFDADVVSPSIKLQVLHEVMHSDKEGFTSIGQGYARMLDGTSFIAQSQTICKKIK